MSIVRPQAPLPPGVPTDDGEYYEVVIDEPDDKTTIPANRQLPTLPKENHYEGQPARTSAVSSATGTERWVKENRP